MLHGKRVPVILFIVGADGKGCYWLPHKKFDACTRKIDQLKQMSRPDLARFPPEHRRVPLGRRSDPCSASNVAPTHSLRDLISLDASMSALVASSRSDVMLDCNVEVRMRPLLSVLCLAVLSASLAAEDAFVPACSLPPPLDEIKKHHTIDTKCGPEGTGDNEAQKGQNVAKNNLCVAGEPVAVTRDVFKTLQQEAKALKTAGQIEYGGENPPADRSKLSNLVDVGGVMIGEGSLVRYVALVSEARHSNVSDGESVNCDKKGSAANDIHLDLVRALTGEASCQKVSAEMIPHLRPTSWNRVAGTGSKKKRIKPFESTPVRVTGQLFFDGSHTPCGESGPRPMARISNWEIHPVYAIDVCAFDTLTQCPASDESVWTPLHEEDPE